MIVLLGSVIVASLLGFALARAVWEPIRRLADQASAVLAGAPELAASPEVAIAERSGDEVNTVSSTLSAMSEHLHQYATELNESREELRQSLKRLGTTLRSTHDLHGMLSVVLGTTGGGKSTTVSGLTPCSMEMADSARIRSRRRAAVSNSMSSAAAPISSDSRFITARLLPRMKSWASSTSSA